MRSSAFLVALAALSHSVFAAPVEGDIELEKRAVTTLSSSAVAAFTPYIKFARAAYCTEGASTWNCGAACSAISDFTIQAGGGDGDATPSWFVGWSASLASVVVAHEGTDPTSFLSLLNDAQALQVQLDQSYFPGAPTNLWVHEGFHSTFKRSASSILSAVKTVLAARGSNKITVVGHSLGGAIAELDLLYFKLQIPSATLKMVGLGVPRVGSVEWASYLDSFDLTRINNDIDPIPIVPGRGLGYAHPDTEVHISSSNVWSSCDGHDNTSSLCSTGAVPNIFLSNILDHLGPYNGIYVGTIYC